MRNIFIIISHFLQLTFTSALRYLFFFVVPILVFAGSIILFGTSQSRGIIVGMVNQDKGSLGEDLIHYLSKSQKNPVQRISRESVNSRILEGQLDLALIIPSDFSENIKNLVKPEIEIISIQGDQLRAFVKPQINNFIQKILALHKIWSSDMKGFVSSYQNWLKSSLSVEIHEVADAQLSDEMVTRSFGFFFFLIMIQASIITALMLVEKQEKTYFRIRLTPLSGISYALGNTMAAFIILMVQIVITLLIVVFILPIDLKLQIEKAILLLSAYLLSSIGLGLLITSLVKSAVQANIITSLVLQPVFFISGCFIPRQVLPDMIQKISYVFPQTWAIMAIERLQKGGQIKDIAMNLFILLGFTAVFLCLFALKIKSDQEKSS
ncbi:MAG: ABC transporter permease [Spirochaetales bacterium]|nr:ABC transporter permease [Spirochaetales bacterium]